MDTQKLIEETFSYRFDKEVLSLISRYGILKKVSAGDILIDKGNVVTHIPLLISGALKIFRQDDEGNEQILYFIEHGDTCAMTLYYCVVGAKSEIKAVAEIDSELILVPLQRMEDWLKYKSWRTFVFETYNTRLVEMLETIDSLAFRKLDERVFKYLLDKVVINKNEILSITHREIALELNTSRVVVSRVLKKLELERKITLNRNTIKVLEL